MYTDEEIMDTLENYKYTIEKEVGYTVYAIMLKGSQNYNLSDDKSDIDANAILIPTLRQLRTGIKQEFEFPEGKVTCHDIYSFAEIAAKGNPQWIEVCNTKYKLGESLDLFKHLVVNPSALKGMVMEKVHAFDRLYPSRAKYVEQFGYDPKQLHHIIRLYDLLKVQQLNPQQQILTYGDESREWMMKIKRGLYPTTKEEAFELRDKYVQKLEEIYKVQKIKYKPQQIDYDKLDEIVMQYYKGLK